MMPSNLDPQSHQSMSRSRKNQRVSLSEQLVNDFYNKGYFVIRGLFEQSDIDLYSQAFDRLEQTAKQFQQTTIHKGSQFVVQGSRIDRIVWMGGAEPSLLSAGEDSRILSVVSQILGASEFHQLICQGHYKLPGDTVKFDWHQDCQHRGIGTSAWNDIDGRGSYVQTLMAIDPVTAENGPVIFVPTDTRRGYVGLDKTQNPSELFDIESGVPVLMQPGDVAFFSPYSIHGSQPNNSKDKRRVFINGFALVGANQREYPGEGSGRLVRLSCLNR
jgi:ectoine hydroxylase-related dioxygenase (phytanoyl-CoA dioxygenase family)